MSNSQRKHGKRCDNCGCIVQGPPQARFRAGDKTYCRKWKCRAEARKVRRFVDAFGGEKKA